MSKYLEKMIHFKDRQ